MGDPTISGLVVKEYLNKFPKTPSKTLAQLIYKNNPALYSNVEAVRDSVRYYRGARGNVHRENLADKTHVEFEGVLNPFEAIPEGLKYFNDWSPHHVLGTKALLLFDAHVPYHEKIPLVIALEEGRNEGIDTIVLAGDFLDFYMFSFWEKDPRKRTIKSELEVARDILRIIRKAFPNARIIYKPGNHEERYYRYMKVKAPELIDLEIGSFPQLIDRKDEFGLEYVEDRRIMKIGHLNLIHGHEFGNTMFNPVNPARGLYLRGKEIAICGHFHQTSQHTEKTMNDNVISCWSAGCLCDLRPEYMPINKWNHGFTIVEHQDGKDFEVSNRKIINGKVY